MDGEIVPQIVPDHYLWTAGNPRLDAANWHRHWAATDARDPDLVTDRKLPTANCEFAAQSRLTPFFSIVYRQSSIPNAVAPYTTPQTFSHWVSTSVRTRVSIEISLLAGYRVSCFVCIGLLWLLRIPVLLCLSIPVCTPVSYCVPMRIPLRVSTCATTKASRCDSSPVCSSVCCSVRCHTCHRAFAISPFPLVHLSTRALEHFLFLLCPLHLRLRPPPLDLTPLGHILLRHGNARARRRQTPG